MGLPTKGLKKDRIPLKKVFKKARNPQGDLKQKALLPIL